MSKDVLVINCGSSSVKFALVDVETEAQVISGIAEKIGSTEGVVSWKINGKKESHVLRNPTHLSCLEYVIKLMEDRRLVANVVAVGHRLVHGGEFFHKSCLITDDVLEKVESCCHLAPLHNPANITGVKTTRQLLPSLPQVGVFDTAFHQSMPEYAYMYAVPYEYYEKYGVRRYGFHGTSHRFVTQKAAKMLGKPLSDTAFISAHLGNGASAAAVASGKSIDTTMGLTPLEGLVMGTRSGDIDPGLISFLTGALNTDAEGVTNILNKKSGLLGLSGLSNDMRELEHAASIGNERAQLALDVFCYRLAKHIAALAVPLGRIDALIFTGGIGENSDYVRGRVLAQLGILGFQLDPEKNAKNGGSDGIITTPNSQLAIVVPTDEELMIAQDTATII